MIARAVIKKSRFILGPYTVFAYFACERSFMPTRKFEPKFMKIGVLTAALQELTPREIRDKDPDRAIEEWLQFARDVGSDNIELSAALHPTESDIPAEAMLDPVANTLDLRQPFDK